MLRQRCMLLLCLLLPLTNAMAGNFWQDHAEGWHWYHDPASSRDSSRPDVSQTTDPVTTMDSLQQKVKQALDKAILEPTPENVKNYIELQNKIAKQASLFSSVWQRIIRETPTLDYSLQHPTNQIGKQVYWDKRHTEIESSISQLAKTHGLFFFFKASCPYCHRYAPIVKAFAERYGFSVIPITLDEGTLPEFPDAKLNNGAAMQFEINIVPALFMVDPQTAQIIPLSYGLISEEDLANRVYSISQQLHNKATS